MNYAYRTTAQSTTVHANDRIIGVDTSSAPVTVSLPLASLFRQGFVLIIKDAGGNANNNNITITPVSPSTIDLKTSIALSSDYASVTLVSVGSGTQLWSVV